MPWPKWWSRFDAKFVLKVLGKLFCVLYVARATYSPALAKVDKDFWVGQKVTYTYRASGQSQVEIKTTLINQKTEVYPTRYIFHLSDEEPQQITAFDALGPLKLDVENGEVAATFSQAVVGKGEKLTFTLRYVGKPATRRGQVWEAILPKLGNPEAIDDYQLSVVTSPNFGRPIRGEKRVFDKQDLLTPQVLTFGNLQVYRFNLRYQLTGSGSIYLPPDTAYQKIFLDSLDPAPEQIIADVDGNWLAQYGSRRVYPLTVKVTGKAHVLATPDYSLPIYNRAYTQPTQFWPKLEAKLATPTQIYDFVVRKLTYDNSGKGRKGALQALATPQSSICTEFTDVFVALARSAGTPARGLVGFAYSTDQTKRPLGLASALHAWPEYWHSQRQRWVSVDPTWGNTTGGVDYFNQFDFNHLALAILGSTDILESELPNSLQVTTGNYVDLGIPKVQLSMDLWRFAVVVTNPTGQAMYNLNDKIPSLLPFSRALMPVPFTFRDITVTVGDQTLVYNNPLIKYFLYVIISAAVMVGIAYYFWRIYLQRLPRRNYLHR